MADKPAAIADRPGTFADTPATFQQRLAAGQFVITAELGPPRGADLGPIERKAAALRGVVDAVNITDNQSAAVRLSALAGSLAAQAAGVEPIMQLTCRDRNRIALQSELLSAAALGVPNVLIMTGDHPRHGDHEEATPVFDLNSTQLLRVATQMRDQGTLMSGAELKPPPRYLLGAVENPSGPAAVQRLAAKVEAGAQFVQTQFVFDLPAFDDWLTRVRDLGLHERCAILAGVGPVRSLRALHHLRSVPGVHIPDRIQQQFEQAGPEHIRELGERICAHSIAALAQSPGVAGVHVMAIGAHASIPAILERAGLPRRGQPRRQPGSPVPRTAEA
jgi:methylenetetrahydrofolate reductase (NADPH)